MNILNLKPIHPSWLPLVNNALTHVPSEYIDYLQADEDWLPGPEYIFNAFSLPLSQVRYILFGESPYPRKQSAHGYAFWDKAVESLWNDHGLDKKVNRATSLRNFMKMLLVSKGLLSEEDTSQPAILSINKSPLIVTCNELFTNMQKHGILLLNASLTLTSLGLRKDARHWQGFMESLLNQVADYQRADDTHRDNELRNTNTNVDSNADAYSQQNTYFTHQIELILFGKVAESINQFPVAKQFKQVISEHPYNQSFITNKKIQQFFKPFDLLQA